LIDGESRFRGRGYPSDSQSMAQWFVCRRARTLQFMEVTGLKPTRSRRSYPKGSYQNRPLGADHDCSWYHPGSKRYLLTDEPYPKFSAVDQSKRQEWAAHHGYSIIQSSWAGMHNIITELYLIGKQRDKLWLEEMVHNLEQSPSPVSEEDWDKLSSNSEVFNQRPVMSLG